MSSGLFEIGDMCVMFHNNWIMTSEAKIYRIKELGLFYTESDYYSNTERSFLTYDPLPESASLEEEQRTLAAALLTSIALHRVLILPAFFCHSDYLASDQYTRLDAHPRNQCTFNTYWCVREFDKWFKDYYREHAFIDNPQVPQHVRDELHHPTRVSFNPSDEDSIDLHGSIELNPKRIQFLFRKYTQSRLIQLSSIPYSVKYPEWAAGIEEGIKQGRYRQLECQRSSVSNKHKLYSCLIWRYCWFIY